MSSKLKFFYFDIKNIYSEDGKYLKHYSGNGLWIKDETLCVSLVCGRWIKNLLKKDERLCVSCL